MSDKINFASSGIGRLFSDRLLLVVILISLFVLHWLFLYGKVPTYTFIVYPFIYLFILASHGLRGKEVFPLEMWMATNSTWFITVMSRVAIPFAVAAFSILVWYKRKTLWGWWSLVLLCLMWVATVLYRNS